MASASGKEAGVDASTFRIVSTIFAGLLVVIAIVKLTKGGK